MLQFILADPAARMAIAMVVGIIITAIILIIIVSVGVEKLCGANEHACNANEHACNANEHACGCPGEEHLCGAPDESMCGCGNEGLAPSPRPARLAPHYGTYTRGPMAPYGALPLPRPPDSSFFRRNHWRGTRWYGPPPSNYYIAHNWHWPAPVDIDAVYWDGEKYAPCSSCEKPEDCRDCPAAKRWFRGW